MGIAETIRREDDVVIIKQKNRFATLLAALAFLVGLGGLALGWNAYSLAIDNRKAIKQTQIRTDESINRVMTTLDQAAPGYAADANNTPPVDDGTPNALPNAGGQ